MIRLVLMRLMLIPSLILHTASCASIALKRKQLASPAARPSGQDRSVTTSSTPAGISDSAAIKPRDRRRLSRARLTSRDRLKPSGDGVDARPKLASRDVRPQSSNDNRTISIKPVDAWVYTIDMHFGNSTEPVPLLVSRLFVSL